MITLKLKYKSDSVDLIYQYIKQYNHVYRVSFNLLNDGLPSSYSIISKKLNNIDLLDSWFIQSSITESKHLIQKMKEIGKEKVIFGGKKNFIRRCKGLITKEEFNKKRYIPLCSMGEQKSGTKSVHGNRKFKLNSDLNQVTLKLKDMKLTLDLLPYSNSYRYNLSQIYKHQVLDDTPITYKIDVEYIYISFDECVVLKKQHTPKVKSNRVLGIDINPNYIGWSIVDWKSESDFTVVKSGLYSIKDINDIDKQLYDYHTDSSDLRKLKLTNKRKHEVFEIVKNIINKSIYYKVDLISVEDLHINSSNKNKGKKYNKLVNNNWCRDKFMNNLSKRCNIYNIKLLKVKPEYSSFIGNFLFRSLNLPDPILASIELGRRGYEFYNQYITKTKEIKKNIVQPDMIKFNHLLIKSLEEFGLSNEFNDLVEIYTWFKRKNPKQMYRVSVDQFNHQFLRLFSHQSKVKHLMFNDKMNVLSYNTIK